MSEPTPGPWRAKHRHSAAGPHDDELSGLGWEILGPEEPLLRGQFAKSADAHLIAAAPELRAALEAAESALAIAASYRYAEQAIMESALVKAREALETARGYKAQGAAT